MIIGVASLPFVAAAVLALCADSLADRLRARAATWLVTVAAVVIGIASIGAIALLGVFAIAEVPWVATLGHWSVGAMARTAGVPTAVAAVALVAATAAFVTLVRRAWVLGREVHDLSHHAPRPQVGDMVVVDDDHVTAFAVGGFRRRRVVLTTGLLALLADPRQRRAVIEHERSHLRHHHLRFRLAVDVASRLNPLLRPTVAVVDHTLERWADADAAAVVGADAVARALLTVALAPASGPVAPAMAWQGGNVPRRVEALVNPRPHRRWAGWVAVPVAVVAVVAVLAFAIDIELTEEVFDSAVAFTRAGLGR